jgi:hypothetical protein
MDITDIGEQDEPELCGCGFYAGHCAESYAAGYKDGRDGEARMAKQTKGKGFTRCGMPTVLLGMCSRPARFDYIRNGAGTSSDPDLIVASYCAQHHAAGGHSRMLRPRPWEYDRIWDRATSINVHERGVRNWPRLGEAT